MNLQTKKLGLALSGGGSKGLAHAGVLKFLLENNINPQHIAGTSAGAIVAALYSFGKSPEQILAFFKSIHFFYWKHFTFTKPGLIDSNSFKQYFLDVFKDAKIGDASIKLSITATNMINGSSMVFNDDVKIVDAILASSAFPGILSPYKIDNELYNDGGILNNFPTDLLLDSCSTIIGVYVSSIQNISEDDLKSIKSVSSRAFDLLTFYNDSQKFNNCNWLIKPEELSNYSTFETSKSKMDAIFKIGYFAAKNSFPVLSK